jgi:hypothetical protein
MYEDQRNVYHAVISNLDANSTNISPAFYYIDGPGSCGKTFLIEGICHAVKSKNKKFSCCSFSGIASTLLPKGRTLHNRFRLDLKIRNSNIGPRSKAWKELKNTDVFIWDEAPTIPENALSLINAKMQEICGNELFFGGKILIVAGDFRQTLPVLKNGSRSQIVSNTLKLNPLWKFVKHYKLTKNMRADPAAIEFAQYLLDVGNDSLNDSEDEMPIPQNCICDGDLAEAVFGHHIAGENWEQMTKTAILAPLNIGVDEINENVLNMLPGDEIVYKSIDKIETVNKNDDQYQLEFVNSLNPPGLPLHELKLKKNCCVMLMRNMNQGLCNGTRMLIFGFEKNILECRIVTGAKKGSIVHIPRMTLKEDDTYPFIMHRHQFPIKLCFGMTINKAQGQTLEFAGIDLRTQCFAHGQVYTAFSRTRSFDRMLIKISANNEDNKIKNIVYKELLK